MLAPKVPIHSLFSTSVLVCAIKVSCFPTTARQTGLRLLGLLPDPIDSEKSRGLSHHSSLQALSAPEYLPPLQKTKRRWLSSPQRHMCRGGKGNGKREREIEREEKRRKEV